MVHCRSEIILYVLYKYQSKVAVAAGKALQTVCSAARSLQYCVHILQYSVHLSCQQSKPLGSEMRSSSRIGTTILRDDCRRHCLKHFC